jgi:hypothetical protein
MGHIRPLEYQQTGCPEESSREINEPYRLKIDQFRQENKYT